MSPANPTAVTTSKTLTETTSAFPAIPAIGWPLTPFQFAEDLAEYWTDAFQRSALFFDILRRRGDEQADMASRPMATVLTFEHDIIMSGSGLPRPINFSLARVIPPAGTTLDPTKRPIVIVDPRAGQGPGIGGFHYESEIGDAFAAGHQVYFIGFAAEPIPGQTFLDVVEGQIRFFERVVELHPGCKRPFAVGNCQAGYQTLMVAMLRPDLFGPILLPGSPMSYWQGVHGKNPMRYAGGLLGGSWLTELASDLGNGKFDGAYLIGNFDSLNPANTFFKKLYDVYAKVDTEGPRFLKFEKWWGDLVLLNGEEIQHLVDAHFIGNKLTANEIVSDDGRRFDIRSVTSPIVVFTSLGDNISPPQQTLGWILDLYASVEDIRNHGQTIVYCVDPKVGHLAIFVSPKVAEREDEVFMHMMNVIDVLPPGLYELVVTPKTSGEAGAASVPGDFLGHVEARTLDDIRSFGRNTEDDDRAFASVARLSEMTLATYRTFAQPFVRAMANEQLAEWLRAVNPVRLDYTLYASDRPWMRLVPKAADAALQDRKPVSPDNTFLKLQEQMAAAIIAALDGYREVRDQMEELMFFSIYGSHGFRAMLGTAGGASPSRRPPAQTPAEETQIADKLSGYRDAITSGSAFDAKIRALLYVLAADRMFDERSTSALGRVFARSQHTGTETVKDIVRDQFFALQLDPDLALQTLPAMIPEAEARLDLIAEIRDVLNAAGPITPESQLRLLKLANLLKGGAQEAPRAEPAAALQKKQIYHRA
jgi:hypothetical protein